MADRSNFQKALKLATKNWSEILLARSQKMSPGHIKPHIYTKIVSPSAEKTSIILGVKMVDSFTGSPNREGAMPGAVTGGGSKDAAALEFGSEGHWIGPRKRGNIKGIFKKYSNEYKKNKTWLGVGLATQRSWMVIPNAGTLPVGAGKGYKPNLTKDGNFVFVNHKVWHPGSKPYHGVGYLRISIAQTKNQMMETEKKSIARAISMEIVESFKKSKKVMFV